MRVWDLAAGGAALFVLKGHKAGFSPLTAFADPATGETRLASGSRTRLCGCGTRARAVRRCGWFILMMMLLVLTVRGDASWLFVAFGNQWGVAHRERHDATDGACYKGDIDAIRDLLQQGAGVDEQDDDGYTPLFVASLKGHVDAARLLLDADAAVDKRREGDWSPFGIACALGHLDVATMLGGPRR